jgi:Domain of unknown function (DUF4365)
VSVGRRNRAQGAFGEASVGVLAAAAGLSYGSLNPDPGYDLTIVDRDSGESIMLQVKTESSPRFVDGVLKYDLDVDAYNRLRKQVTIRTYLVVMDVRRHQHEWVACMEWAYLLRHRAYYCSLQGYPETSNTDTVAVPVPHVLTPAALTTMIEVLP